MPKYAWVYIRDVCTTHVLLHSIAFDLVPTIKYLYVFM